MFFLHSSTFSGMPIACFTNITVYHFCVFRLCCVTYVHSPYTCAQVKDVQDG